MGERVIAIRQIDKTENREPIKKNDEKEDKNKKKLHHIWEHK